MSSIEFFTDELTNVDWVVITQENGTSTSMLKSTYNEMIAQQGQHLTENPTA